LKELKSNVKALNKDLTNSEHLSNRGGTQIGQEEFDQRLQELNDELRQSIQEVADHTQTNM